MELINGLYTPLAMSRPIPKAQPAGFHTKTSYEYGLQLQNAFGFERVQFLFTQAQ